MSGTNHWAQYEHERQPRIVLVRPQMGENIGASARAMWNFGLEFMHLVAPRDGWPNPSAVAMASGAAQVLDKVEVHENLIEAVADCHYVMATTARSRDLTKEILTPKRAMARARDFIDEGKKTACIFGAERAGLENSEIAQADAIIHIPVNPAFGSLNLAQSVLLLAYEWQLSSELRSTGEEHDEIANMQSQKSLAEHWGKGIPANFAERDALYQSLAKRLEEKGFFWPEDKAEAMQVNLQNMIMRLPLSQSDVQRFHGIFRALARDEDFANKKR